MYTKGSNGEHCGLRVASIKGVPLKTVGAEGRLAMWDCSGKSDPVTVDGKKFSTVVDGAKCSLRLTL